MHDLAFEHSASGDGRSAGLEPKLSQEVMDFWAKPVACRMLVDSTLLPVNFGHVGLAESSRRLHQRVQNDLQIEGRAADDLQHLGGAVCCCSDSRSSLSSRVFSIAITAWAAKFVTSSICFSLNGRTSWR